MRDDKTKEVSLFLKSGEVEKAYRLSLFDKALAFAKLLAGILALPATTNSLAAIIKAIH